MKDKKIHYKKHDVTFDASIYEHGMSININDYWGEAIVGFDLDKSQSIAFASAIIARFKDTNK